MTFSERLKFCRQNVRYKQREMAEILGVTLRTYQRYEAGEHEPNMSHLIILADFFDVSIDWLTGRTDQ